MKSPKFKQARFKKAMSSTVIAASVVGAGVFGATALTGVAGAERAGGEPVLAEITSAEVVEIVDTVDTAAADDGGLLNVQDVEPGEEVPAEGDGEREGCDRRGHRGGRSLGTVAEVLGLEVDELRAQLQDGATIADIAGDQTDDVIDALVTEKEERIAEKVEAGRITQEEADEKLAELEERITDRVNNGRPDRGAVADTGEIAS